MSNLPHDITLYFIRHGETDWNRMRRLQGQMDIPLNDAGRLQAARNGRALREIVLDAEAMPFVASPMLRTTETMEILREAAGFPRDGYQTDDRLREVHYGSWEGAYLTEVAETDPAGYAERKANKYRWRPRGGESYADLSVRAGAWLSEIAQDTIVVSHGGVSRVLRGLLLDLAEKEIPVLEVPQDRIMILRSGHVSWA
ncbi:MAG: histidine phosphatase family protein [Pseudomonadota bacterium]